jgi:lysozyme family protein
MIQKIVGAFPDGVIGRKSLDLINNYSGEYPLSIEFKSERLKYYMMLTEIRKKNLKYLKGWIFRAMEL